MAYLFPVGSKARGSQKTKVNSPDEYVTSDELDDILSYYPNHKLISKNPRFVSFKTSSGKKIDIWKVPGEFITENILLRSLPKATYIEFAKTVHSMGYEINFNGIKKGRLYYDPEVFVDMHNNLKHFKKDFNKIKVIYVYLH